MSVIKSKVIKVISELAKGNVIDGVEKFNAAEVDAMPTVPQQEPYSLAGQQERVHFLRRQTPSACTVLEGSSSEEEVARLKGNIENFVGMTQVPTGVMGPLVINGTAAKGGFYVPLATSEGALVASYARGARACRDSGAIVSACIMEGVQRCPIFRFNTLVEVGRFVLWITEIKDSFTEIVRANSRFAELSDLEFQIEGNQVILTFEYTTGDASGQNMVTIVTQAICEYIIANTPVKPNEWYIESNFSGDKKATSNSYTSVRGKNVTAEITLKREVIEKVLKTTPEWMFNYYRTSFMGAVKCGAIGGQGHFANGLAAVFIACGQDAACVSEASVGITRMEVDRNGDLYCAVTLPNLIVGTIGGGTSLPTQRECLEMMDCYGEGKARKFAEICASVCLAGEISIIAAMSAGHFSSAHERLGRK